MAHMPVTERRGLLLSAAFDVIAESGVSGATTRAIVDAAGMKLASFHYAFESRDALLAELVDVVLENQQSLLALPRDLVEGVALIDPTDHADPSGPAELEAILRWGLEGYFAQVRQAPQRERAMFELTQYWMRAHGTAHLAARQYDRYRELAEESLLEAAARSGRRWLRPLPELAADLVALTDGITLAWLADPDDTRARATITFAARALAAESAPVISTAPTATASASAPSDRRISR